MERSAFSLHKFLNSIARFRSSPLQLLRPLIRQELSPSTKKLFSLQSRSHRLAPCKQQRCLHMSSRQLYPAKTVEEAKAKHRLGPFSLQAGVLFMTAGIGLIVYFRFEKDRMARQRIAESTKGVGKPKVGGSFELVDQYGRPFTDKDLLGRYSLVYFGFTNCPDICPEELDKMALMLDQVYAKTGKVLLPVFITCDPARDKPDVLKHYLDEFHPAIVGLTGTWQQIKDVCKAYRVYFSTPPSVKPGQDYLVDHSIYFYLMDPEGDFVEAIGRNFTVDAAAKLILNHIGDWKGDLKKD